MNASKQTSRIPGIGFIRVSVVPLVTETIRKFQRDKISILSAALAYFAMFSLFPLLLIVLGIIGFLSGSPDSPVRRVLQSIISTDTTRWTEPEIVAYQEIINFVSASISPEAAQLIDGALHHLSDGAVGASLIGVVIFFWIATNIFDQMNQAFQIIWEVDQAQPTKTSVWHRARNFAQKRLIAFGLVVLAALVMIVSLAANAVLALLQSYAPTWLGDTAWEALSFGVAFVLLLGIVLLLFKYMPATPVAWGDVWLGALMTALLITLLVELGGGVHWQPQFPVVWRGR
ncbi:MAG: YihY/virulence factor BrkB family protein [Chloroflexales bacterium]|nr:YihY/virulence factor BrkB family protein [Chloroflexales bacterium]